MYTFLIYYSGGGASLAACKGGRPGRTEYVNKLASDAYRA